MGTLILLDVDGVLALDPAVVVGGREAVESIGYRPHQFDGTGPDGTRATGTVWLNPAHGVWLNGLRDRGAQLVWATSWGVRAADWIAPRLDLPADLPVVEVPNRGVAFGRSAKQGPIRDYAQGRPLAWLDDQFGGKDANWAADRRDDDTIPTLLVPVEAGRGLLPGHIEQISCWLDEIDDERSRA